jgi:hypothetical protein
MKSRFRHKLMLGAAALVVGVPVGLIAAVEGPTMFAAAGGVQDPVMCNITSGTIPTQSVHIAATKSGSGKSAQYLTGYCPGFASSNSLKALKNLSLVSSWTGGAGGSTTITTKSAGIAGPNSLGEAGFAVPAKFGTGSYAAKVAQVIVFLTASETAALATQCASGPVSSVTFDSSTSTIVQ